jgi:hypothetical protein
MRVGFQTTGGLAAFPGLAARRTIDIDRLPPDDRQSFERLVADARFFDLPSALPPPDGSADYRTYRITIEDASRHHTVTVSDPVREPALQALIARLHSLTDLPD